MGGATQWLSHPDRCCQARNELCNLQCQECTGGKEMKITKTSENNIFDFDPRVKTELPRKRDTLI